MTNAERRNIKTFGLCVAALAATVTLTSAVAAGSAAPKQLVWITSKGVVYSPGKFELTRSRPDPSSPTRVRKPVRNFRDVVRNGLSMCSIHHRAFDEDLVGVAPDLRVHVSSRLLDDEDGPMLDVLKGFHGSTIEAPTKRVWRTDRERLELRFVRFQSAG